jgi:hypothetical protein
MILTNNGELSQALNSNNTIERVKNKKILINFFIYLIN